MHSPESKAARHSKTTRRAKDQGKVATSLPSPQPSPASGRGGVDYWIGPRMIDGLLTCTTVPLLAIMLAISPCISTVAAG